MLFPLFNSFAAFCYSLIFIIIHVFDYPDPRLSGVFRVVPLSPDNRGSTVAVFEKITYCWKIEEKI